MDKDFFKSANGSPNEFRALFCPISLINALGSLGIKHIRRKSSVYPCSHKCEFRFNPKTYLIELHIRTNTYVRMAKRTYKGEKATGVLLRDCLVPLIWGIKLASTFPQFQDKYDDIRAGLFALMVCYQHDQDVQIVLASVFQSFPPPPPSANSGYS